MIAPEQKQRFEEALHTEHPAGALHDLAVSLRDVGTSQLDLYLLFEHFFVLVQNTQPNNDVLIDAIADGMDPIWGGPWARNGALYGSEIDKTALEHYRQKA